ncbi:uncharacterized protein LOC120653947 [Panicum virgatum]|uniref:Uncharacterized protein n=1 Tax=Panicum virgatum TaxID=38727 RepID=A0A8T0WIV4_PANVG|nr:uncharacterized protein LOC120653947 [Panicum virgatum]KAG2649521.1 hypothetical protein PVAP13_1NG098657 [Panicum virgatum]
MRPSCGEVIPAQQQQQLPRNRPWRLPRPPRPWGAGGGGRQLGLSAAGLLVIMLFLTVNAGGAIYLSLGDTGAVVSAAVAYASLIALVACVAMYARAPADPHYSPWRSRLRAFVWLLTMSLTFHYVYEATAAATTTKPTLNRAMMLWAMPAATGVAVFYVFFQVDRYPAPREEEIDFP